jgi:hypothetical protein
MCMGCCVVGRVLRWLVLGGCAPPLPAWPHAWSEWHLPVLHAPLTGPCLRLLARSSGPSCLPASQAVEHQQRAVIISERVLGQDHPETANAHVCAGFTPFGICIACFCCFWRAYAALAVAVRIIGCVLCAPLCDCAPTPKERYVEFYEESVVYNSAWVGGAHRRLSSVVDARPAA